jgi:uncharacterized UPF0160 family protein
MTDNIDRIQSKIYQTTTELLEKLCAQAQDNDTCVLTALEACAELTDVVKSLTIKVHEFELKIELYDEAFAQQLKVIETFSESISSAIQTVIATIPL